MKNFNFLKEFDPLLTEKEAGFLMDIPKQIPKEGFIVDIGSHFGASAVLLAMGSKEYNKGKVVTIEKSIRKIKIIKKNIKGTGLGKIIVPICSKSDDFAKKWNKPITFLFIDAGHEPGDVKKDFLLWEKYLIKGGIIALHDSHDSENRVIFNDYKPGSYKGPRRVIKQNIINSKRFKNIKFIDSITYAEKIKNRSLVESIRNRMIIPFIKYDNQIGKVGLRLKEHFPKLYKKIKFDKI